VELSAQIEMTSWSKPGEETPPSAHTQTWTTHCVVGTNTWLIEGNFSPNKKETWWLAGTNFIVQTVPQVGEPSVKILESIDGNPIKQFRGPPINFPWLAFCSGPFLKREGRRILPRAFDYPDTTTVFEDDLGLPRSVELYATNNQPVYQYRVSGSTNVLGWNFPLEFHVAQYRPRGTNAGAWELVLTASGKVTSISLEPNHKCPASLGRLLRNKARLSALRFGYPPIASAEF
jgi:hypothetical protein